MNNLTVKERQPTTNDGLLHVPPLPATLTVAISVHWIVPNNPMGGTVYGHTRPWGHHLAQTKTRGRIFYRLNTVRALEAPPATLIG